MLNTPVITKAAADALALGQNGSYSNEGNVLQHTLFDSVSFDATTIRPETNFFTSGQGQTMAGTTVVKSANETNLRDSGKLPNGQTFLIKEFSMALIPAIAGADTDTNTIVSAYLNIIQNGYMNIKIAGREFDFQTPGSCFTASIQALALGSAANVARVGEQITSGWLKLGATPIPIGQLVTFSVDQFNKSAIAAVTTILNTASDVLSTQNALQQARLRGVLTRSI